MAASAERRTGALRALDAVVFSWNSCFDLRLVLVLPHDRCRRHGGVERMKRYEKMIIHIKKLRMSHPSISFRQEFIDLHPVPWLDLWGHELLVRRVWIAAVTDAHSHRRMPKIIPCCLSTKSLHF